LNPQRPSEPDENRHPYRWANRIAAVLAVLVGLASGLTLILEGLPPDGGVELRTATKTHSTTSNCVGCEEPEITDTEMTVKTISPREAGGQSVLERALNNDVGVTLIRILFSLPMALATAVVVRRIVIGLIDGWGHERSAGKH
jgi:hypothetical protein